MTPLTNCQAWKYALIPGLSEDFENIANEQGVLAQYGITNQSPLFRARSILLIGITTLVLGIIGMIVTSYHHKFVAMTMGGVLLTVGGMYMLYEATVKVQNLWNNRRST